MSVFSEQVRIKGETNQKIVAMEECSELIKAITKSLRGKSHNIEEEIVDVEIMIEQLKEMEDFNRELYYQYSGVKIDGLKEMVYGVDKKRSQK